MENDILNYYIELVEFIGLTIGPDYEIALYDLRNDDKSIIAIANGHITGRSVGAPLTEAALKAIQQKEYQNIDSKVNFTSFSHKNKVLRSSIQYIKDSKNELIGLLCINFDDSNYVDLTKKIMSLCHPDEMIQKTKFERVENLQPTEESDNIGTSMEEVADLILKKITKDNSIPLDRLTKDEKINVVKSLDDKGIFMLKGSVPYVAKLLYSSEATIYRYLNDLKES